MLGLGWTEMLVIGVVALIVIGPKDLPVVMGKVGRVIGQIQRMGREFQREINKTTGLDEVRNLRNSITSPLKQTAEEIRKEFNAIGKDGSQSPTGALKPTDPNVESVVDAIHEKAGMAPKKSANELAKDYGFKSSEGTEEKPAPIKAARPEPSVGASSDSATTELKVVRYKPTPKPEAEETKPAKPAKAAKAAKPKSATSKAAAAKAEGETTKPKAAKKPAKKAAKPAADESAAAEAATGDAKPAAKPRAPRKKADTAGKTE